MDHAQSSRLIIGDQYEIDVDNHLGSGGMAVVYLGTEIATGLPVAVKTLRPEYQRDPESRQHFRREAKTMQRVSHPHLVQIRDLLDTSSGSWLVMEFVDGEDLRSVLADEGPLDTDTVEVMLRQVGDGLAHIHAAGLVHLDVKPQNIIRRSDGSFTLIDFGLAQQSGIEQERIGGSAFGTIAYLAPEQAAGRAVTPASDVYSLACVVYELLTGRTPFVSGDGEDKRDMVQAHIHESPPLPTSIRPELDLGDWVDVVLGWAMAKDPDQRYGDVPTFVEMFARGNADRRVASPATIEASTPAPASLSPVNHRHQVAQQSEWAAAPAPNLASRPGSRWLRIVGIPIGTLMILAIMLIAVWFSPLSHPAISTGVDSSVVLTVVNVRSGPGMEYDVVDVLPEGHSLEIVGGPKRVADVDWWEIRAEKDGKRIEGWMWGEGVRKSSRETGVDALDAMMQFGGRVVHWFR